MTQTSQGRKYDSGKLRYDLVPTLALEEVVKVITKGAEKYDDDNWKNVPEGRRRYYAASMRHQQEWKKGNPYDEEMGTHHIANAISNLMFILEKELQGWEDVTEENSKVSEVVTDNTIPLSLWYPDPSGKWIEYDGNCQPVSDSTVVEVLLQSERESGSYCRQQNCASEYYWQCDDYSSKIVAYKVCKG